MALPRELAAKLGKSIRMLASDKDGDIIAAAHAILRMLQSHGTDIHALAEHIENGSGNNGSTVSEQFKEEVRTQMRKNRETAYAEGVRATEARFRPDGRLGFVEVALYVARERRRLRPCATQEAHENRENFINKMELYAIQELEPYPKQGKWLFDLFVELRGKNL